MKESLYLEISRKDENLEICLSEGEQTIVHYEECRVPAKDLQRRSSELLHLLNSVSRQGKIPPVVFQELQQIGQVLFNEIFPLSIKKELADTKSKDLILKMDNRLVQIPWELMYNGEEFFCERFNVGRMVKTQQMISGGVKKSLHSPIKMLIIADPKGDLPSAYEEGNKLRESFNLKTVSMTVISSEVSIEYLKRRLLHFDFIHYAGHADYDLKDPSLSGWILEDGKFTALDIRKFSGTSSMPALVFSNACQSGTTEEWQVEASVEEKIYGLANAFLLAGVQHYIGTFWKVLDEPSTKFAIEFYRELFAAQNIGQAMRSARRKLKEQYGRENVFWASYLLYGDPTTQYFKGLQSEKFKQEYQHLPPSISISPTSSANQEMELLIQDRNLGGVLWKTRSPSELMEKSWQAEQGHSQGQGSSLPKTHHSKIGYITAFAAVFTLLYVFFPFLKNQYNKKGSFSQNQVSDFSTMKASNTFIPIDWGSENSVSEFFQGILKKYRSERKTEHLDSWTSRPITLFFNTGKSNEEAQTAILIHKIIQKLQKNQRITILEREELDTILQELALSSSDLVASDSALRLGELLSSTLFNNCNLFKLDSKIHVTMRLIENETTVVKAAFSEEWEESSSADIIADRLCRQIIDAIEQHFPIQGKIKSVIDYDKVILNIGASHGLKSGWKLKVIKDQKIFQNGEVISEESVKGGEVEVNEVRAEYSYSKVLGRSEDLAIGMKVIPVKTSEFE